MHLLANATSGGLSNPIGDSMQQSMTELWTKVAGFVPNLVGMFIILAVGYAVSKLLQRLATGVLKRVRLDKASEKTGLNETMERVGIQRTASEIVGVLVFWLFMLTFLISAADALGLENVSKTIDSFVAYLPNVVGALLIVVVGLLLANFVRTAVEAGLDRAGLEYAKAVSKLAYGVLIVVIGSLTVGQLQIETTLINRVIEIGLITPPIGVIVFVLHGMAPEIPLKRIFSGIIPFFSADLVRLAILVLFPVLTLWLPRTLGMVE